MFTIEIAGIPIAVDNHFESTKRFCREYLTDREPVCTVSVSEEEMKRQRKKSPHAVAEQLCVYRMIALSLMNYDAFLMHAAVIDIDRQGLAFVAGSGTGKTTRALLWKKALGDRVKIVNGDKPILRFIDEGVYAYGTPWMGKEGLGENTRTPIKAVCFLGRGENVSLHRLQTEEIIPRLFTQVLIPKDAERLRMFMALMERFVHAVPFWLFICNMEKEEPGVLWEQIRGQDISP